MYFVHIFFIIIIYRLLGRAESSEVLGYSAMDTSNDSKYWIPTTKDEYPHIIKGGEDKASGETLYVGKMIYEFLSRSTNLGLISIYPMKNMQVLPNDDYSVLSQFQLYSSHINRMGKCK